MNNLKILQGAAKLSSLNRIKAITYLQACVQVGQINRATEIVKNKSLSHRGAKDDLTVEYFNAVLKGWAGLGSLSQVQQLRQIMNRLDIEPNMETYSYFLLCYAKSNRDRSRDIKYTYDKMKELNLDPRLMFQQTYLGPAQRRIIVDQIKRIDPQYTDLFPETPIDSNCKLLDKLKQAPPQSYKFIGENNLSDIQNWFKRQKAVETKTYCSIKSVANYSSTNKKKAFQRQWNLLNAMWTKRLEELLDQRLDELKMSPTNYNNIYPFLCTVSKTNLIEMILEEIEHQIGSPDIGYSISTISTRFGRAIMNRHFQQLAIREGRHDESIELYKSYIDEYCRNPELMGKMNSREFIMNKAIETKNYSICDGASLANQAWPTFLIRKIGHFIFQLVIQEIKFDPEVIKNPHSPINMEKLLPVFYTAYLRVSKSDIRYKEELRPNDQIVEIFKKGNNGRFKFNYSYLPTVCPPRPWITQEFGGYLTMSSNLARSGHILGDSHLKTNPKYLNTCNEKLYPSYDSLNAVSLCPWIVNKEILDIAIKLFRDGGDKQLAIPLNESKMSDLAPKLVDNPTPTQKNLHNIMRKKHNVAARNEYSLWMDCLYKLSIANHFRDKTIWFPHNMDFRGRFYPIPPHFHHLGGDLARSLLLFARGRALGDGGLDWLKIHVINLTGKMKKNSMAERLKYANSILHSDVLDSADNPFEGRRWWTDSDDPWQTLACCKEIAKAIRSGDPKNFVSHFPVHQDGSCNGLQHYAALGRDLEGAVAVNLVPNDRPQDVYSKVVDLVEAARRSDEKAGVHLARQLQGVVERRVIKQTVMTTVYGVTKYGARMQIARKLEDKRIGDKFLARASSYLTNKTFESIGKMFSQTEKIQNWFTDCARIIVVEYREPVSWETPLGFRVTQPYLQNIIFKGEERTNMKLWNTVKQRNAFPPNFIHSLDSSHMMLTSLWCQRAGVTFASVHDCFWTHAASVDEMNRICRQQFVALHSEPILENLYKGFVEFYTFKTAQEATTALDENVDRKPENDVEVDGSRAKTTARRDAANATRRKYAGFPILPGRGELDLKVVLDSVYFFN